MKRVQRLAIQTTALVCAVFLVAGSNVAFAQSSNVQKALEDVKTKVDDLVSAKDESPASALALRIATFKKVLSFAITEAEDLKVKLLTVDEQNRSEMIEGWRNGAIADINKAIAVYRASEQELEDETATLSEVQKSAEAFKAFREDTFSPLADTIQNFLLLNHEEKVLTVATRRLDKVSEDVKKLEAVKFKGAKDLKNMLAQAETALEAGEETHRKAWTLFEESIFADTESMDGEEVTTATTTLRNEEQSGNSDEANASSSASSAAGEESSIKDLAKSSLDSVQEAYRIFIEMSNFVRKLLK